MVLRMFFLTFSDLDLWFAEKKLIWRSYITAKALPIINRVQLIVKKEFAQAALDENSETFVVNLASILETISIHLARNA